MNNEQSLRIVSSLANGVDPVTNEPIKQPSILQEVEVIRALYVAVRALESTSRSRARMNRGRVPAKAGKPWTEDEDRQLLDRFDAGESVAQLAEAHERTLAGVQARLEKHGRMLGQGLQWRGRGDARTGGENAEISTSRDSAAFISS